MPQQIQEIPANIADFTEEVSIASIKPSLLQTWPSWLFGFLAIFVIHYLVQAVFLSLGRAAEYLAYWAPFINPAPIWEWVLLLSILILPLWRPVVATWRLSVASFEITNRRILYTWGILNRRHDQIELARVRDVRVIRPLVLRLIRQGEVHIESVDRQFQVLPITGVTDPIALKNTIHELNVTERKRLGYRELEASHSQW